MNQLFHDGEIVGAKKVKRFTRYNIGDIIVFKRSDGKIIIHMIENHIFDAKGNEFFITIGLNPETNQKVDSELVSKRDIVGKVCLSKKKTLRLMELVEQGKITAREAFGMEEIKENMKNTVIKYKTTNDQIKPIFSVRDLLDSNCKGDITLKWIVIDGEMDKLTVLKSYTNEIGYKGSNIRVLKDSDVFNLFREKHKLGKFEKKISSTGNVAYLYLQNEYIDDSFQTCLSFSFSKEEPLPYTSRYRRNNRIVYSSRNHMLVTDYIKSRPFSEFHAERKEILSWLLKTNWDSIKKSEATFASERGFCPQCYKYIYLDVFRYLNDIGFKGDLTIKIRNLRSAGSSDYGGVCTNSKFDNPFIDNSENQNIIFEYKTFLKYYAQYGEDVVNNQPYYHYINEVVKSQDW